MMARYVSSLALREGYTSHMVSLYTPKATLNSARVNVLDSLGSDSFSLTDTSPQSTIRLSLISEQSRILIKLTSLPARIWLLRC